MSISGRFLPSRFPPQDALHKEALDSLGKSTDRLVRLLFHPDEWDAAADEAAGEFPALAINTAY